MNNELQSLEFNHACSSSLLSMALRHFSQSKGNTDMPFQACHMKPWVGLDMSTCHETEQEVQIPAWFVAWNQWRLHQMPSVKTPKGPGKKKKERYSSARSI